MLNASIHIAYEMLGIWIINVTETNNVAANMILFAVFLSFSLCVFLMCRVGCAHSITLPHPLLRALTLEHSNTLIFALCEQFQQHCSHCIGFSKLLLLLFNSPANDILSCAFCQPFANAFVFSSLLVSATSDYFLCSTSVSLSLIIW